MRLVIIWIACSIIVTTIVTFIIVSALGDLASKASKELNKPDTTITCNKGKCDTLIIKKTHRF